jgi:hypothetical protein
MYLSLSLFHSLLCASFELFSTVIISYLALRTSLSLPLSPSLSLSLSQGTTFVTSIYAQHN